jgi:nucleoid-associated protein YgaU
VGIVAVGGIAGCRTAVQRTHVPRVDLQLEGAGNRGYLVGTPPPVTGQKVTRELLDITVELPAFTKALPAGQRPPAAAAQDEMPIHVQVEPQAPPQPVARTARGTDTAETYTVQRGDSLWSIAARPEIYGNATQWRALFEANRDQLASPNALKAGMVLRIPRGESVAELTDEGTSYRK